MGKVYQSLKKLIGIKNNLNLELTVVSIEELDAFFEHLSENSSEMLPDGILDINIKTLHSLRLLAETPEETASMPVSHLLQAIESGGKITLFNERFVIWIVPQQNVQPPTTIVYVAQKDDDTDSIRPELGFRTSGIHNRSKTILKLIDKFLADIQETETVLSQLECDNSVESD